MRKKSLLLFVLFAMTGAVLTAQSKWVISVDGLKMRSASDFNASSLGIIPYGEKVLVRDWDSTHNWAKISWEDKTGWVYASFLSGLAVEPRSVITKQAPSRDRLIGTWYTFEPFCLEEKKFRGNPQENISTFTTHHFYEKDQQYKIRHYEGGASGIWTMKKDQIFLEGKKGYEALQEYTDRWSVSFYQIRQDWLVKEIMAWRTDSSGNKSLVVDFLLKPLSNQSKQKVQAYYKPPFTEMPSDEAKYAIGDSGPAGGIIFYDKGDYSYGWRYLEAAPKNQGRNTWEEAKEVCHNLELNGYNDWRLPTRKELNLMYENLHKKGIGNFYTSSYWCSSGDTTDDAFLQSFNDGSWYVGERNKKSNWLVHAVRAF